MEEGDAPAGFTKAWAYHCTRCNYLWFPRDFDLNDEDDIFDIKPPKACARCKSKQWSNLRIRNTKHSGEWSRSFSNIARIKSLKRSGLYGWFPIGLPEKPTTRQCALIRAGYSIRKCTFCGNQNAKVQKYVGDDPGQERPIDAREWTFYACLKCAKANP